MPVDENGNRADIIMDPNSKVGRMNLGGLFEQYFNAASRDVQRKIAMDLGVTLHDRNMSRHLMAVNKEKPALVDQCWNYLLGYYKIVSPRMYNWFVTGAYTKSPLEHLTHILRDNVYLYLPTENDPEPEQIMMDLEKYYPPIYGPVTYTGNSGKQCRTRLPARIGSMYVLLLEKIADDWTAVSSALTQHFGVLSQVTSENKYRQPNRAQPVRATGEAEVRIYVSYAGWRVTAEILDRNNNPTTHKELCWNLMTAPQPTNVHSLVDRQKIPLGQSRPLQLVKHLLQCGGSKFVYKHVA